MRPLRWAVLVYKEHGRSGSRAGTAEDAGRRLMPEASAKVEEGELGRLRRRGVQQVEEDL